MHSMSKYALDICLYRTLSTPYCSIINFDTLLTLFHIKYK